MQNDWLKQTAEQPLFPEILWSRPENRRLAGKLLIVGGSSHSFKAPADAYGAAVAAGVGYARVVLPDTLAKNVIKLFPEASFAPTTPSGSFARTALAELLDSSEWADAVLLAGNFGKNSETAILLESLNEKYSGLLTLTGDSLDYFNKNVAMLNRPQTLLAPEFGQLQKLIAGQGILIKHSIELAQLVEILAGFSQKWEANVLTAHVGQVVAAIDGQVSTTPSGLTFLELATRASVFWLQNPSKPFEAISSAVI